MNTLLSIIGLTVGFSSFIIISLFIKYELDWDRFNTNYEHIYRIQTYKTVSDELIMQSAPAVSEFIKNKFEDIENQSLVFPDQIEYLSASADQAAIKAKGQYADQHFMEIFSYEMKSGTSENALKEPFSIILSSSLSNTLFGDINPVGNTLLLNKKQLLKITGVYEDLPKNAHLRPEYIISLNSLLALWNETNLLNNWLNTAFYTYILTKEEADIPQLGASLKDLMKDKIETDYRQLQLAPLSSLYMYSTNNNYTIVLYLLGIFSLFVLALAAINYMNLSIASGTLRGKEIGIKKVIGSNRRQLMAQIILESTLVSLASLLLSCLIVELSMSPFNLATGKELEFSLLFQDGFYLIIIAIIFMVSIISSIYPSWLITSVSSIELFKQNFSVKKRSGINLKKFLVGFQFAISIGLITLAVLMSRQIQDMHTKDFGFEKENLLFIEMTPSKKDISFDKFKQRLAAIPEIQSISLSRGFPIQSSRYTSSPMINWEGGARNERLEVRSFWTSYDYAKTLNLKIVAGREFRNDFPADVGQSCMINETAARQFGWEDPIGKYIDDKKLQIVGVFQDMLFHDTYNKIKPLVLTLVGDSSKVSGPVYFGFRIDSNSNLEVKPKIEQAIQSFFPMDPFEVILFTDHYKTDQIFVIFNTINNIFIFFSIIAIILSVLGVIGLVNHSLNQRTKEIAIRKVSGCSSISIFRSLTLEYVFIILIAAGFGSYGARYMFNMLPLYYPIEQRIMDYLIAIIIALTITLLSIFYKTLKESTRNPVDALRHE
jgi:putative ABC transport system permease protein